MKRIRKYTWTIVRSKTSKPLKFLKITHPIHNESLNFPDSPLGFYNSTNKMPRFKPNQRQKQKNPKMGLRKTNKRNENIIYKYIYDWFTKLKGLLQKGDLGEESSSRVTSLPPAKEREKREKIRKKRRRLWEWKAIGVWGHSSRPRASQNFGCFIFNPNFPFYFGGEKEENKRTMIMVMIYNSG